MKMIKTLPFLFVLGVLFSSCTPVAKNTETRATVHQFESPAKAESGEPFLTADENGNVHLSWTEVINDSTYLKLSKLDGEHWMPPVVIASGNNWFVNWADYPVIVNNGNNLLAHFLDRSGDGTYAYDIKITSSSDNGLHWTEPSKLHDDNKEAEHGFVSMVPYKENFFVTWLDGRKTAMEGMKGMEGHEGHHGAMTLRAAIIGSTGKKISEWELDEKTCDCCQTSAAITSQGPVVVYRDRSEEEIRDISIVRLENGSWTTPKTVYADGWEINGCPVNGPKVVADGRKVAIAWFTAANDSTQVKVIFSTDGGVTFGTPVTINEARTPGRIDLEMMPDKSVIVSWMEGGAINAARVQKGIRGETVVIAKSSSSRKSGFPQIATTRQKLLVAWTDDSVKTVKVGSLPLQIFH
jgi:hypothetical protein